MNFNLNKNEMEQRRYNAIKKSGEYIELNILIGVKQDKFDGHTGKIPVIQGTMKGCGSEEIANMYTVLQNLIEYYEETYPMECMLAKATMDCNRMGVIDTPIINEEG